MITPLEVKKIPGFIGRQYELSQLEKIGSAGEPSIIIMHGRRRVGKTALLERAFRSRNILKFEGIEGAGKEIQIETCVKQLSEYATNDPSIKHLKFNRWLDFFNCIADYVSKGKWTLYFEELQWLACHDDEFISELKHAWDNKLKNNPSLLVILCGSSPSFMIESVVRSKALYNRSQHEMPLQPFSLKETHDFLGVGKSRNEVLDAYLTVGGIPEYLKYIKRDSSIFLGLCRNSFLPGSFFAHEYDRIFTSSLAVRPEYKKIIRFLGVRKYASRNDLLGHLKTDSGGTVSKLLEDLRLCGFADRYSSFTQKNPEYRSRFVISDPYLNFYHKFIEPVLVRIAHGDFRQNPCRAIQHDSYRKWLGHAFERFCRKENALIADRLGFGAVSYRSGAYFSKDDAACQIDLVFERQDRVYTVCEIKYTGTETGKPVIRDFEKKLAFFKAKRYSIHKVLVTPNGADKSLGQSHYFDDILTMDDFFAQAPN